MDKKDDGKRIIFHRLFGGLEENRTPVRKPLDMTFSVGSQFLLFPTVRCQLTNSVQSGSTFVLDRFKCNRRCKFTAKITLSLQSRYFAEERVTRRLQHC